MAENKENSSEDKVEAEATIEPAAEAVESSAEVTEQAAEAVPEPEVATEQPGAEAAPEEPVAEATPEPEPAPEEPPAEVTAETDVAAPEEPKAEAAPEPEGAPEQPAKRTRSQRHVSRAERRKRPAKVRAATPAKKGARKPLVRLPKPEAERGSRQERRGVVVSSAMDKTIVVKVDTIKAHPKYRKVVRRSKKYHAHDEQNAAKVGDVVRIVETRPLSATKSWRVVEIVEVAK
jgi:small subunit ribosomal protein S17